MRYAKQSSLPERVSGFVLAVAILAWSLWPITSSALQGDDLPNSMRTAALEAASQSRWDFISDSIGHWIRDQGRFFPVSAIENVYIFSTIHDVALYKMLQLAVLVLLAVVVGYFVRLLVGTEEAILVVALTFCASLQTRNWYDPTFGFSLLLQSVALKVFLSAICLQFAITRPKKLGFLILSVTFWTTALLQYEVVITLLPTFFVIAMMSNQLSKRRRLAFMLPHLVVALTSVVVSQHLRAGKTVAPAYTTNVEWSSVFPTYLRQLSGSVPFSAQLWDISPRSITANASDLRLVIFVSTAIILAVVIGRSRSIREVPTRKCVGLFVIGSNFVFGPGLPTSMSVRWQTELSWGLAYLPVFLQYLGVALMMCAAVIWLGSRLGERVLFRFSLCVLLVGVVLAANSNRQVMADNVSDQQSTRHGRALYESAVRAGLFKGVSDGSIIRSPLADPNLWVNSYFTTWLGGPNSLVFVRTADEEAAFCGQQNCEERDVFSLDQVAIQDGASALVLSVVAETNKPTIDSSSNGIVRVAQDIRARGPCWPNVVLGRVRSIVVYKCAIRPDFGAF